jgi:hypothetical protein
MMNSSHSVATTEMKAATVVGLARERRPLALGGLAGLAGLACGGDEALGLSPFVRDPHPPAEGELAAQVTGQPQQGRPVSSALTGCLAWRIPLFTAISCLPDYTKRYWTYFSAGSSREMM